MNAALLQFSDGKRNFILRTVFERIIENKGSQLEKFVSALKKVMIINKMNLT